MKLTYLGTAAAEAIPGMFCDCRFCENARRLGGKEIRRRSGAVIDGELMIDFSPDVNCGINAVGMSLVNIKNILFTHSHSDHCCPAELEFRRSPSFCLAEGRENLHIYGNGNVEKAFTERCGTDAARNGFDFTFIPPYEAHKIGNFSVTPLSVIHNPPEDAYIYLIERNGVRLLYANDTGVFPEKTFEYLKGIRLDIVSLDCTTGYRPNETGHMGFPANLKVKKILTDNGSADENTIFISHHFSHNGLRAPDCDWTYDYFMKMAEPCGFIMSYDGLTVEK